MARPIKKGIDYFSFDTDFFTNDRKIRKIRHEFGSLGIVVYIFLITEAYKEFGYYVVYDEDLIDKFIDLFKCKAYEFAKIVNYIIELQLLKELYITKDIKILTSERIQRTYQASVKTRGNKTPVVVNSNIWIIPKEELPIYMKIE